MQTEGGWGYLCKRPDNWFGFTVMPYRSRKLSVAAVSEDLRSGPRNPTGPEIRGLRVEASDRPVEGSFRYVYAIMGRKGAEAIAIGYVTPSGWVVEGLFPTADETPEFEAVVASYAP